MANLSYDILKKDFFMSKRVQCKFNKCPIIVNAPVFKIKTVFLRLVTCDIFCISKLWATKKKNIYLKLYFLMCTHQKQFKTNQNISRFIPRTSRLWHKQNLTKAIVNCLILRQLLTLSKRFF